MIEYLGRNIFTSAEIAPYTAPLQEFQITLKIRLENLPLLWRAAVQRYIESIDASVCDIEDILGPVEDPSIENCLITLALPDNMPGCAMLDVSVSCT